MRKKLLPLAMLAGLAGAAGTRNVQAGVSRSNVLIYPYFTADEGHRYDDNVKWREALRKAQSVKLRQEDFIAANAGGRRPAFPSRTPKTVGALSRFWKNFNETIKTG